MALPWLMPAAFECPVVIGDQGGNRTPDTRIPNPFARGLFQRSGWQVQHKNQRSSLISRRFTAIPALNSLEKSLTTGYSDCAHQAHQQGVLHVNTTKRRKVANALDKETRLAIPTKEAAHLLCRRPQTLHRWACYGEGPIQPIRVHTKLLWPVAEIRKLLDVNAGRRQFRKPSDAP